MAFTETKYIYDSIIRVGDENAWIELGVSSKGKDIPVVNLSSSKSKFSTIAVSFTLFSDAYENALVTNSFSQNDLEESTTITRKGMYWEVTQAWSEEEKSTVIIPHKDMIKLLQHCSRKVQTNRVLKNKFKQPLHKKVYKVLNKLYNTPRKLLNW